MQEDINKYQEAWDQVDEPPMRAPLPPEPKATNINEREGAELADEFNRAESMPVRTGAADARSLETMDESAAEPPKAQEPKTFSEAFRQARDRGDKTFMWRGKPYTTKLKSDAAKPAVAPPAPQAAAAPAPAAGPAQSAPRLGMKLPASAKTDQKPSMYSRSMAQDIGDAVRGRAAYLNEKDARERVLPIQRAARERVINAERDMLRGGR